MEKHWIELVEKSTNKSYALHLEKDRIKHYESLPNVTVKYICNCCKK